MYNSGGQKTNIIAPCGWSTKGHPNEVKGKLEIHKRNCKECKEKKKKEKEEKEEKEEKAAKEKQPDLSELHPELPRRFIGSDPKKLEAALSELFPDLAIDMDTLRSRMMKNDDEGGLDLIAEILAEEQEIKKAAAEREMKKAAADNGKEKAENQVLSHIALERADDKCDWKKFIELLEELPDLAEHIKLCGDVFQWNYRDNTKIDEANQAIIKGLLGEK